MAKCGKKAPVSKDKDKCHRHRDVEGEAGACHLCNHMQFSLSLEWESNPNRTI